MTIDDLPPTIQERYGRAVEATDMSMRAARAGPADILAAAGMVGARHPLSLSLWRWLYGGDDHESYAVIAGLQEWVVDRARVERWKCGRGQMARLVIEVAGWYKDRTCRSCHGARYLLVHGTPYLSDTPCPVCRGTGERSLDKLIRYMGKDWPQRGYDMVAYMDGLVRAAGFDMMHKLYTEIYGL